MCDSLGVTPTPGWQLSLMVTLSMGSAGAQIKVSRKAPLPRGQGARTQAAGLTAESWFVLRHTAPGPGHTYTQVHTHVHMHVGCIHMHTHTQCRCIHCTHVHTHAYIHPIPNTLPSGWLTLLASSATFPSPKASLSPWALAVDFRDSHNSVA